jgi:WD40 repeat protein
MYIQNIICDPRNLKNITGHTDIIYALVWSQDSSLLASSGLDGAIRLWDVKLLSLKIDDELHSGKLMSMNVGVRLISNINIILNLLLVLLGYCSMPELVINPYIYSFSFGSKWPQ